MKDLLEEKYTYQHQIDKLQTQIKALNVEMVKKKLLSKEYEEKLRKTVASEIFEWVNHPERVQIDQDENGQWCALYRSEEIPFEYEVQFRHPVEKDDEEIVFVLKY
jgi:hypothetical protein